VTNQPDDSASLAVPAGALDPKVIVSPPVTQQYTSAEGPQAVRDRAATLKAENDRAAAEALRKANRMIRYLYLVIVVYAIVLGYPSTHALEQAHSVCVSQKVSAQKFNAALDTIVKNSLASTTLTPAEKIKRVEQYGPLHEFVPVSCPGALPWEH
jgi:hypothetical protein